MANNLEFILKLQDLLTPGMRAATTVSDNAAGKIAGDMNKIGHSADVAHEHVSHLHEGFKELAGTLGIIGLGAGLATFIEQGREAAHAFHESEAALKNTMQNMGTYSEEAYEKVIASSKALSANIKFSRSEVIDLQSQLRLVGNIGENEMGRLVAVSADLATKFHMGLGEAGNAIAKAVNNPEMLRRLAMQVKIDPAMVKHLQDLAKNGHEAQARLELLNVVEQKVGGAAAAAFNADPMARYNKIIGATKLHMGEIAIKVQAALAPALVWLANTFSKLVDITIGVVHWFGEHKIIAGILTVAVLSFTAAVVAYNVYTTIAAWKTEAWFIASKILNVALWTNPVTWIVLGVIALIAVIGMVIYMFDGWGKQWAQLMKFSKFTWAAFKDYFSLIWLQVTDGFMSGIELMEKGWFHLKSLWDEDGANAGLAKINNTQSQRAAEIMKAKGLLTSDASQANSALTWEIHRNNKNLSTVTDDLKKKLGLGGHGVNPVSAAGEREGNGKLSGGGLGDLGDAASKSDSINKGGQRNIVINISKVIDKIEQHILGGASDVAHEIGTAVREEMHKVINSLNGVATS